MQAVDMYAAAGKWSAAHKVAMGFLPEAEVHVSHTVTLVAWLINVCIFRICFLPRCKLTKLCTYLVCTVWNLRTSSNVKRESELNSAPLKQRRPALLICLVNMVLYRVLLNNG